MEPALIIMDVRFIGIIVSSMIFALPFAMLLDAARRRYRLRRQAEKIDLALARHLAGR